MGVGGGAIHAYQLKYKGTHILIPNDKTAVLRTFNIQCVIIRLKTTDYIYAYLIIFLGPSRRQHSRSRNLKNGNRKFFEMKIGENRKNRVISTPKCRRLDRARVPYHRFISNNKKTTCCVVGYCK